MNRRAYHSSKLVFFRPNTPKHYRVYRLIFTGVWLMTTLAMIAPVYPQFSGINPTVAGLPFSLFWLMVCLFVMFVSLWALFLLEKPSAD